MQTRQTGVWLIGGRGSVATTTMTGAAAVAAGLAPATGLVTSGAVRRRRPARARRPRLRRPRRRRDAARASAPRGSSTTACSRSGCPRRSPARSRPPRPSSGPGITGREARSEPRAALARIVADLQRVPRRATSSTRVVVVNVSSTEAPVEPHPAHDDPDALMDALDRGLGVLPPSSLYALAAIETGCAFVDFTPSIGARLPALEALAEAHEVPLGRQRRQDRRDVHEVGARAGVRRPRAAACARGRA